MFKRCKQVRRRPHPLPLSFQTVKLSPLFSPPPPHLGLFSCSHACLKRGGEWEKGRSIVSHILQISRFISLTEFEQWILGADRPAQIQGATVTVVGQRWPPPIQSAPVGVIKSRDYPNAPGTVRLVPPTCSRGNLQPRQQWNSCCGALGWLFVPHAATWASISGVLWSIEDTHEMHCVVYSTLIMKYVV